MNAKFGIQTLEKTTSFASFAVDSPPTPPSPYAYPRKCRFLVRVNNLLSVLSKCGHRFFFATSPVRLAVGFVLPFKLSWKLRSLNLTHGRDFSPCLQSIFQLSLNIADLRSQLSDIKTLFFSADSRSFDQFPGFSIYGATTR